MFFLTVEEGFSIYGNSPLWNVLHGSRVQFADFLLFQAYNKDSRDQECKQAQRWPLFFIRCCTEAHLKIMVYVDVLNKSP